MPQHTCPRCHHDLSAHGTGCTIGWFGAGGSTQPCHCPNDWRGRTSATCARVGCNVVGTHVDRIGQFYCAAHREGVPIDEVTDWVET